MLSLETLSRLVVFADCGTLSETSRILHISQPSLTKDMKKLEDELRVSVFERKKNKIALNETGMLAVSYARKVLDEAELMTASVRLFDRANHTVNIGSVAPAPLWRILPACSSAFPQMTVSSELKNETELLQGLLAQKTYKLIVLPYELRDERCRSFLFEKENLCISVPKSHPLSRRKSVRFSNFDGETMLVFSDIGFWDDIHKRNLPSSRFIYQSDRAELNELIERSNLPTFATDLSLKNNVNRGINRIAVPIDDPAAHASFYISYRCEDESFLRPLLKILKVL